MGFLGEALGTTRGDNDQSQNVNFDSQGVDTNLADLAAKERAEGGAVTEFMKPITSVAVGNQAEIGKAATGAAGRSFDDYLSAIGAVKADAAGYDSPEQMERVRQEAAGNANSAFDVAQQSRAIQLAQMGVNPNSGRFADPSALALARTTGVADAMNRATADRNDKAIALRSNVAGLTGNAATGFSGVGVAANRAAVDTGVAGGNAALPWMIAANQPLATQAGLLASQYGTAVKDAGQTLENNMASKRIVSDQILGWGKLGVMASSKTFKTAKRKVDESAVLEGVKRLPVEKWRYKKGIADEGEHIGPYAEDVQREFGDKVAPGGKVIDMISMFGVNLAAIQALAKQVDKLERR